MDLLALKLNTVFKLNLLCLEQQEIDKLCDRVMRGNTKSVRKLIFQYIRQNTQRKSNDYFYEFTKKKNLKYLKRMSLEQIQEMIALELNRCLSHDFRDNISNLKFQEIVLRAIDHTSKCPMEDVRNKIPQWIKNEYADVQLKETKDEVKVINDPEAIFNIKLLREKQNYAQVVQDTFELVDHLEYIHNLKVQINERMATATIQAPKGGMIDAFEYAEYLRQSQVQTSQLRDELRAQKNRTRQFLLESDVPKEIKSEVINNDFQIKNNQYKMFLLKLRKKFENFIINEKYGQPPEQVWNKQTTDVMRRAVTCLEYSQENPTLNLDQLILNVIKCDQKKYNKFVKMMAQNKRVKVIKVGKVRDKYYIVYDYLVPKKWFKNEKFFREVEQKISEPKFTIDEEVEVSYKFPYHSNWQIQNRFAYNFRIFLNKNGIKGLSERLEDDMIVGINNYQIYYPLKRGISKSNHISKEQRIVQYKKVYASFHHKQTYTVDGIVRRGGNIVKCPSYECGDVDLDFFIADIDARSHKLYHWIQSGDPLQRMSIYESFFKEVQKYYIESHAKHHLIKFLNNCRRKHAHFLLELSKKLQEIQELKKQAEPLHGNSKHKRELMDKVDKLKLKLPSKATIESINNKMKLFITIRKEVKQGTFSNEFKLLLFERLDQYCETRWFRRVCIHRDVVSYALTMINNLNIGGVARTYDTKKGVFHKYMYQFKEELFEKHSLADLFKCLLRMSLQLEDNELFDELFEFLYQHELERKEKLLLTEFKGY